MSTPLIGRVIAEPPAVEVLKRYEGLLLHDTGMHMVVLGEDEGRQLMDVCPDISLEKLHNVFKNLDSETQLVMLSTNTPNEKLGIMVKFKMEQINTLDCLHTLSIPDRIH